LRAFEYSSPASAEEALRLLTAESRALAGGTDLLPLMKADLASPSRLVNVKRFLDDRIREDSGALSIGALAVLDEIEKSPVIRQRYTALAEAAAAAASPQLRNMATLGGNLLQRPRCWYFRNSRIPCWLKGADACPARDGENRLHALYGGGPCHAVHPSDPAAALLALEAQVRVRGRTGERLIPAAEFFVLPTEARRSETVLGPDELILSVEISSSDARSTYLKAMERKVWTFALAGVAAVLRRSGGRVQHARVVLTGVAPIPWRAKAAERVLERGPLSEALLTDAAEAALEGAAPLAHNAYKVPLLKALVRRALVGISGLRK
jgi:xanthine dehydrogenase YagS FAD-binding subunit